MALFSLSRSFTFAFIFFSRFCTQLKSDFSFVEHFQFIANARYGGWCLTFIIINTFIFRECAKERKNERKRKRVAHVMKCSAETRSALKCLLHSRAKRNGWQWIQGNGRAREEQKKKYRQFYPWESIVFFLLSFHCGAALAALSNSHISTGASDGGHWMGCTEMNAD